MSWTYREIAPPTSLSLDCPTWRIFDENGTPICETVFEGVAKSIIRDHDVRETFLLTCERVRGAARRVTQICDADVIAKHRSEVVGILAEMIVNTEAALAKAKEVTP